jgi:imidazolonepropionase
MNIDTLIIHATQLVTCASDGKPKRGAHMRDLAIIPDGAVAIHGGKIVDVGTTNDLYPRHHAQMVIEAHGKVVCPGFVDCHTHAVYGGDRLNDFESRIMGKAYMDILAEGGGILSTMRATRQATLSDLTDTAHARLTVMVHHGTTTAEIKTGYGLDTATEIKLLQAIITLDQNHPMRIIPTFLGAHAVPPEFSNPIHYANHIINDMLPAIYALYQASHFTHPLSMDVFCEQGVFDLLTCQHLLMSAQDTYRFLIKAHVDEFVNLGAVPMAVGLKAQSVDHLDVTTEAQLGLLAKSNTVGVFLPAVNFHLGNPHYGNARALIDANGVMALATDLNPGSAPTPSLPMVMAIACRYQKLHPAEALNAITINGASALGLEGQIGSIEIGKDADVVIVDAPDYRTLAYEFGTELVSQTIIKGKVAWNKSS